MRRFGLVVLVTLLSVRSAPCQSAQEKKATIAYLQKLQTRAGDFFDAKAKPSLRTTTAALRALRYFGGDVPYKEAATKFVRSCFDAESGGFKDSPHRDRPDPISTAIGVMAMVELKLPVENIADKAIKYLDKHASSFEEVRMAAAALETIQKQSSRASAWIDQIWSMHNAKGTFGKEKSIARDTAGCVVTILRLGGKVPNREVVVAALKDGQRKDGGFGKGDSDTSDLETCYRVVRAFVMLKEKPADVPALRKFVARCRNADGGYGVAPGQPSNVGATYFASIILHWLTEKS
jgi:prenyltransferase beta subunit